MKLPFIIAGQAQKEIWHNESLQHLDLVVAGAVEEAPRNDPPSAPVAGACYIVGPSGSGVWAGRSNHLAGFTQSGWRFVSPVEGMTLLVRSTGETAAFVAGSWELGAIKGRSLAIGGNQVVGERLSAIANPSGGGTVDMEARTAVAAILAALRAHGLIAS